jgi:hypothetical protein
MLHNQHGSNYTEPSFRVAKVLGPVLVEEGIQQCSSHHSGQK